MAVATEDREQDENQHLLAPFAGETSAMPIA